MHDLPSQPYTVYVKGIIDGSTAADGSGYTRIDIKRDNVSLIGVVDAGNIPTFNGVYLVIKEYRNIVLRNLRFIPGRDNSISSPESGCTAADPDYCDWNATPDGITIEGTQRVWIDHCEFTDGPDYMGVNPNKSHYKQYDGLLDIKKGANYLTISYTKFYNHDKTMLVGHSDSNSGDDFHVTFFRNYFAYTGQRAPRVRFGQVHLLNNLYENRKKTTESQKYFLTYAIGLGFGAQVYSERNVFDVEGAAAVDLFGVDFDKWSQYFTDVGSWLNGAEVDLTAAAQLAISAQSAANNNELPYLGNVGWNPANAYDYPLLQTAEEVRAQVKANAGVGRISLGL